MTQLYHLNEQLDVLGINWTKMKQRMPAENSLKN